MINNKLLFGCVVVVCLFNQFFVNALSNGSDTTTVASVKHNYDSIDKNVKLNAFTAYRTRRENDGCHDDCPFNFAPVCVQNEDGTIRQFSNECILKATECTENTG